MTKEEQAKRSLLRRRRRWEKQGEKDAEAGKPPSLAEWSYVIGYQRGLNRKREIHD